MQLVGVVATAATASPVEMAETAGMSLSRHTTRGPTTIPVVTEAPQRLAQEATAATAVTSSSRAMLTTCSWAMHIPQLAAMAVIQSPAPAAMVAAAVVQPVSVRTSTLVPTTPAGCTEQVPAALVARALKVELAGRVLQPPSQEQMASQRAASEGPVGVTALRVAMVAMAARQRQRDQWS